MSARSRWVLWLILLSGLAWLVALDRRAPGAADIAAPVTRPAPSATRPAAAQPAVTVRDPIPRDRLVPTRAEPQRPRDLFAAHSWAPPPAAPPPPPPAVALAPPPPPAPPPFTYLGKQLDDRGWQVYLGRGELAMIVRAGDTIEGGWRVESIRPPTLTMVRGQQPHQIAIGEWE